MTILQLPSRNQNSSVTSQQLAPAALVARMRERLQSLAYGSSVYRLLISGPVPRELDCTPSDPWPGDAALGQEILNGSFVFAGQRVSSHPPDWLHYDASPRLLRYLHGFAWLRDLRAVGGDSARRMARNLLASWHDFFEQWTPAVWEPVLLAERLTHLVSLHDFALGSAETEFRARIFDCFVRQHRHLLRMSAKALNAMPDTGEEDEQWPQAQAALAGTEFVLVLRGLVFAGVALPDGHKAVGFALQALNYALVQAMLPDGSNVERNPARQATLVKALVDIRQALRAASLGLPPELPIAIDRATASLRAWRHSDGSLALFNGAREENPVFIDALLTQADARGRAPRSLAHAKFERLQAGRMLVICDVGAPPAGNVDQAAHAGLGSFECSVGRERLIVNCGSHPGGDASASWHGALAATAAHSTLGIGERNLAEILPRGGVGRRPGKITHERVDNSEGATLKLAHDGYAGCGLHHARELTLDSAGEELRGEEVLTGKGGQNFALRFHLHPDVQASLTVSGETALLRLPSGAGFSLRCASGEMSLEESLYYGKTSPRRSAQLVIRGMSDAGETRIGWVLAREKKA